MREVDDECKYQKKQDFFSELPIIVLHANEVIVHNILKSNRKGQ